MKLQPVGNPSEEGERECEGDEFVFKQDYVAADEEVVVLEEDEDGMSVFHLWHPGEKLLSKYSRNANSLPKSFHNF